MKNRVLTLRSAHGVSLSIARQILTRPTFITALQQAAYISVPLIAAHTHSPRCRL